MPRSFWLGACATLCLAGALAAQDAPLHQRIDEFITAKAAGGSFAPRSDDGEFLRRIYLDLAGRIPTAEEARIFFADGDSNKRSKKIDALLASEDYARRMSQAFHVMLMERLGDHAEWQKYLQAAFAANKPWDVMAREMLNPSEEEATRGAGLFYSKRLENYGQNPVDIPALVRDVGRLFMGIDVQCAQCHDHLFVDDYKQEYYQGLFAFVGNLQLRQGVNFPAVVEKPLTKKVEFVSVFVKEPKAMGPRLPGLPEIEIPTFEKKGEEFEVPPDPKTKFPGKLKFSPVKVLAEQLPTAGNQLFKRNIVNRAWWHLMGRGLVHPLDLQHAGNAGSHPELLDLLADSFAKQQFDLKWLFREIANSETYQRTSVSEDASILDALPETYRLALEKPLSAEQLLNAMLIATGEWSRAQAVADAKDESSLAKLSERFAKAFALPAREPEVEHAPSVKAALFLLNDNVVLSWLKPREGNLADRLMKLDDVGKLAEELYLSVVTRLPEAEEQMLVAEHLAKHGDGRDKAVGQLIWALLASNEFGVGH
jgi:hypothetical protein